MSEGGEALHIETSYKDIERSDAIDERIRGDLMKRCGRFADRLTRLEVHVSDENAGKSGPDDKRCLVEARPKGLDPVTVEASGSDLYLVVDEAAGKMRRLLDRMFDKLEGR